MEKHDLKNSDDGGFDWGFDQYHDIDQIINP
jgi:hypothetical protein